MKQAPSSGVPEDSYCAIPPPGLATVPESGMDQPIVPTQSTSLRSLWRVMAGNAGWLIVEKAVRWIVGFFISAWVARHLGPSDFGLLSATLAWSGIFACAAGLGVEPIIVRELVRRPAVRGSILGTALALRTAGGLLAASSTIIATLVFSSVAPAIALTTVASLITLFSLGETLDLWFQANLRARQSAPARMTVFILSCAMRIMLVLIDAPLVFFLWSAVIETLVVLVLLGLLFRRAEPVLDLRWNSQMARSFLAESWPNVVANLAAIGYLKADRVMLASMSGENAAGIYSVAITPVEAWYVLPIALIGSAAPMLTRLHGESPAEFLAEVSRLARLHAAIAWALALGLALNAYWLIKLIYGPEYAGGAPVLLVLAFTLPFAFQGLAVSPWYQNTGLTALAMRRHLVGGLLNIAVNLVFIPKLGPTGAALATLVAYLFTHVLANGLDVRTRPLLFIQLRALALLPATTPCKSPHS